jgi:hypothetical protein
MARYGAWISEQASRADAATVAEDAAAYVVDNLAMIAGWTGKENDEQVSVEVRTTDPERAFHLDLGPGGVGLAPSSDDTAAVSGIRFPPCPTFGS